MQNITSQPPTNLHDAGFFSSKEGDTQMITTLERAQATLDNSHAEVDRLTAWPDVVDVMHEHAHAFLKEVQHWTLKGYELNDYSMQSFQAGDYYVLMFPPKALSI
jgi:hypothetical protein